MNTNERSKHGAASRWLRSALAPLCGGLSLFCAGCQSLDGFYSKQVETRPGPVLATNVIYHTNLVLVSGGVTNAAPDSEALTRAVRDPEAQIRRVITPELIVSEGAPVLVTNLVPRPGVEQMLRDAGELPLPFAGVGTMLLAWFYTAYAALRNRRLGLAVVRGVQAGREFLQGTEEGRRLDERLKRKLIEHQAAAGVVAEVRRLLDRHVPGHTRFEEDGHEQGA